MGYGEFRPIVDIKPQLNFREKQEARAANRRVEIYLDAFITQKYKKQNS
jgi:flagellar motor protein MotB